MSPFHRRYDSGLLGFDVYTQHVLANPNDRGRSKRDSEKYVTR